MSNEALPLTEQDLKELASKVKSKMKTEFGNQRIDVWFMSNDPNILHSFVKNTFDQVRIKLLTSGDK